MDVALMSIALNQGKVQQQTSLSVMKKAMDQSEVKANFLATMLGETELQSLQRATEPHLGMNIDLKG